MTTQPPPQGQNPYGQGPYTQSPQAPGPYAQTPQAPGPYAQSPYVQNPYGQAPAQGIPAPVPPAPGRSGSKKLLRILGAVVVAVLVIGVKAGIGWWASRTDAETTSVGTCMHNDGTDSNADLNEVDCSSSDAQFKVVGKFDDTSDDSKCKSVTATEVTYIQSGSGHDVVLCLKEVK